MIIELIKPLQRSHKVIPVGTRIDVMDNYGNELINGKIAVKVELTTFSEMEADMIRQAAGARTRSNQEEEE